MKAIVGTIFMLAGGAVVIVAIYLALQELGGLYGGALNDPLGQPDGTEKAVSERMIRAVIIGAVGVPFFIVGTVLVKAALFKRVKRAIQGSQRRDE